MSFGDEPGHGKNLRVQGQQQTVQEMLQSSVDTYALMLNSAALFPFRLYQQSLAMATQVTRGGLRSATGVARLGTQEVRVDRSPRVAEGNVQSDRQAAQQSTGVVTSQAARQSKEAPGRVAQDNAEVPVRDTRDLRQNAEVAGETRVSGAETTGRTLPEVDEAAPGPSDPVSSPSSEPPEVSNTVDELPPSPAPEAPLGGSAARAVHGADQGSVEPSSRAEGGIDEATPGPSSTLPSPDREESVRAEEPPSARKAPPTDGVTGQSLPPEVSDVELPPPPPVPQNILDELPPPPDEPTSGTARVEKPRIHVRKITAAAQRKAEELNVDLAEVEGTGRDGQITVGDVRKKAAEKRP